MANENNDPPKANGETETPAAKSAEPAGEASAVAKPEVEVPAKAVTAVAPKPAVPPKPPAAPKAPIKPDPWSSPLLDKLRAKFPDAITEAVIFRNQPALNITVAQLVAICEFLKSPSGGAYTMLTDETAVDFPKREKRFDLVYHLYSFEGNDRLRLRVQVGAGEKVSSVTSIWPTANWLEREIFDMFGVV
jgi:NADH-quinone oxidoreductase subunit C